MAGDTFPKNRTMFPARDIIDLLQARASSGRDASRIVESLIAKIITKLQRDPRFDGVSHFEFELLLADVSSEAEKVLFAANHGDLSFGLLDDKSKVKADPGITQSNLFR